MSNEKTRGQATVIGSGPAGMSAAIYLARAGKSVIVFGSDLGQLETTTWVENYPGFAEPIMGPKLMQNMREQAIAVGVQFVDEMVVSIQINKDGEFDLKTDEGIYHSKISVIATGSKAKWLGLPSETKYRGYGVSSCATCDGTFYKDQNVLVVGGGNTAIEEAIYLSDIAKKVTLIHRRDTLRGEQIMQKRLFEKANIEILWNTELQEVLGTDGDKKVVTGAILYNNKTQEVAEKSFEGIFIAIGHEPQTELVRDLVELKDGYIKARIVTKIPGLYVAGDVADYMYRQAITAAGDGCRAALEAIRFLEGIVFEKPKTALRSIIRGEHEGQKPGEIYKKLTEISEESRRDDKRGEKRGRGDRDRRASHRDNNRSGERGGFKDSRPDRGFRDHNRGERSFDRPRFEGSRDGDRGFRDRNDRPDRGFGDRGRSFGDRDHPQRGGFGGGFRGRPSFDRPDRGPRSDGEGRPERGRDGERRSFGGARSFGDRPQRGGFGGGRPSFGGSRGGFRGGDRRDSGFGGAPRKFGDRKPPMQRRRAD